MVRKKALECRRKAVLQGKRGNKTENPFLCRNMSGCDLLLEIPFGLIVVDPEIFLNKSFHLPYS
jgi:hypothetical protein